MATGKRYYWIKLKDTFMTSDAVDFLMSQPDGANYVVLYQMLCLKTINTEGRLERQIGEVLIPYDEAKIQRDTKWFSIDTVRVALKLYQALGLIYTDCDGKLVLTDFKNLVGSETDWAIQKRANPKKAKLKAQEQKPQEITEGAENFPSSSAEFFHTDIRDKRLDIRDKRLDKDIKLSGSNNGGKDIKSAEPTFSDISDLIGTPPPPPPTVPYSPPLVDKDAAEMFTAWDKASGRLSSPAVSDELLDLLNEYGLPTMLEAIRQCVQQNVVKLAYLKAVLRGGVHSREKEKADADAEVAAWLAADKE